MVVVVDARAVPEGLVCVDFEDDENSLRLLEVAHQRL